MSRDLTLSNRKLQGQTREAREIAWNLQRLLQGLNETGSLAEIDAGFLAIQLVQAPHLILRRCVVKDNLRYCHPIFYGHRGRLELIESNDRKHLRLVLQI